MALGKTQNNPTLLDTLLELNDLVHALGSDEYDEKIKELKERTGELRQAEKDSQTSRSANEKAVEELALATEESNKYASIARKEREALAQAKLDQDKRLNQIKTDQDKLEADKREFLLRTDQANASLDEKAKALLTRTAKVEALEANATALKAEYEDKLEELKKITG